MRDGTVDPAATVRLASGPAAASRQVATRDDGADRSGSAFAPVVVEAVVSSSDGPIAPRRGGGAAIIEILIGAATVRVGFGIDVATLTTVLRAVRAAT